ncbi:putative amidohydrolase YtcJ [Arthrobacter stackebrandtii]|uniref:Amidohydrolase YtcJ n=1 Tax=Arthrobacter stackebrandtii TaxID=272161 RepID=A0ABS4YUD5_9MICC|nr:putative amidohydrolase YtcJ [Arthrobacter stackebrandtii]
MRGVHAEQLFYNGTILTMAGPEPSHVECLVTSGGRIAFAGAREEALRLFPAAEARDLAGAALLPGFVDAHSHLAAAFDLADRVNVGPPPMGACTDIASVLDTLEAFRDSRGTGPDGWVTGYGYDQEALAENRHITAADLDARFPQQRVMLVHVSSHGIVLNSAALAWAGIDETTATPAGGVIARVPGTQQPAGLLMETAYLELVAAKLPVLGTQDKLELLDAVQQGYASRGYTHAHEGFSGVTDLDFFQQAADAGLLYLDVAALGSFVDAPQWLGNPHYPTGKYRNGFKIAGLKVLQDGSPQGRTAFMREPYLTGDLDGNPGWRGEPTMPFKVFAEVVATTLAHGVQLYAHVNGDGAIDNLIDAVEQAGSTVTDDARTVAIHSQFQRPEHLPAYVRLGITPSYFTNHTYFWGDVHRANVGEAKAAFISPMQSALEAGLRVSNHSDFPVTALDPMFIVSTAMNRTTRTGHTLGPAERVGAYQALQALTSGPAYQLFEEDRKGMLKVGMLADLVMLDADPLTCAAGTVQDIRVLETIKEGVTVYRRP